NTSTLRSQENNPKTSSTKTPPTYPFQFHIQFSKISISNRPGQTLEEGPAVSVNGLIRPPHITVKQSSHNTYPQEK
ncbi:hypothetical protein, partial [Gluconobacter sp. P1D12_c]|uniref:hypothetical protein n=1 Tax=Gluconobacter sp. P1D12_c TaxID=2762614 RepID=UPI001C04301B